MVIYVAKIPELIKGDLYCKERIEEINSCTNEKVKKQKFYAWKLLELCAENLGFNAEHLHFYKLENGKWKCNEFDFSLSHSEDYVSVILSNEKVGIDLQKSCTIKTDFFAEKILTRKEGLDFINLSESEKQRYLLKKWTQKECVYKMLESSNLKISEINCNDYPIKTCELVLDGDTYYLSYAPTEKDIDVHLIKI